MVNSSTLTLQKIAHLMVDRAEDLQQLSLQFTLLAKQVRTIDPQKETEVNWANSQGLDASEPLLEAIAAFEAKLIEYQ
jgi:hypothetical protein